MTAFTEDEARTKWCPFARTRKRYENGDVAMEETDSANARCIASGCMAWRWAHWSSLEERNTADEYIPSDGKGPPTLRPKKPEGDGWERANNENKTQWFGWTNWKRADYSKAKGFCGLAGKP